jgi:hypothetical protein
MQKIPPPQKRSKHKIKKNFFCYLAVFLLPCIPEKKLRLINLTTVVILKNFSIVTVVNLYGRIGRQIKPRGGEKRAKCS